MVSHKKIKTIVNSVLLVVLTLISLKTSAQVAGENCSTAINLGQMISPLSVNMANYSSKDFTGTFAYTQRNDAFFYIDVPNGVSITFTIGGVSSDLVMTRISTGGTCSGADLLSSTLQYFFYTGSSSSYTYNNN